MLTDDRTVISKGSKSFYLASFFFPKDVKEAAWKLYRWCRYCDDLIDSALDRETAQSHLEKLRIDTYRAFDFQNEHSELTPEFLGLREICLKYSIPIQYPLDLLQGFEMDASETVYTTPEELETYSYYVAGVVGLMMTRIFGASSSLANRHAVDLGIAMQLTNIARDVHEDYRMKRVYLPRLWLKEHSLSVENLLQSPQNSQIHGVVDRLLTRANSFYQSGYEGLQYLPLRAAFAVSVAGSIYSFIGSKVRRKKQIQSRAVVSLPEKLFLVCLGAIRILPLALNRIFQPWKKASSLEFWRPL